MKKITKEYKRYKDVYVACDGTEFDDVKECEKYEKTARAIISARYRKLVVKKASEWSIFNGIGNDDNMVEVVKVESEKDVDTILQMWTYIDGNIDIEESERIIRLALDTKDLLIVNRSYDDDCFWVCGTRKLIIEKIYKNLDL